MTAINDHRRSLLRQGADTPSAQGLLLNYLESLATIDDGIC